MIQTLPTIFKSWKIKKKLYIRFEIFVFCFQMFNGLYKNKFEYTKQALYTGTVQSLIEFHLVFVNNAINLLTTYTWMRQRSSPCIEYVCPAFLFPNTASKSMLLLIQQFWTCVVKIMIKIQVFWFLLFKPSYQTFEIKINIILVLVYLVYFKQIVS